MTENPFLSDYDELPEAPPVVFKYVGPARTDVLKNGQIRFTPLTGTNDIFEVRQTFEQIAGPRMKAALSYEADAYQSADIDRMIDEELAKLGLSEEREAQLRILMGGADLAEILRAQAKTFINPLTKLMNDSSGVTQLVDGLFGKFIVLSLTEHPDNLLMWAHYAASSTGFVIAFDTSNDFFHVHNDAKGQRLHQIRYFGGAVPEIFDDPATVMFSKTSHWAYEHEWRAYRKLDEADTVLENGADPIHLVNFPAAAISRVIAGARITAETLQTLKDILRSHYPHVKLTRMQADRRTATLIEVEE